MNKEQNIDDILKLLRDSVTVEETDGQETTVTEPEIRMSQEELEKHLKNQYLDSEDSAQSTYVPQREYVIDSDFLNELENPVEAVSEEEAVEEIAVEEIAVEDAEETVEQFGEDSESDAVQEEEAFVFEENGDFDADEYLSLNNEQTEQLILEDTGEEESDEMDRIIAELQAVNDTEDESDDELEQVVRTETEADDEAYDNIVFADERTDDSDLLEIEEKLDEVEEKEEEDVIPHHETFLASMRKTGVDFTTDDIYKSTLEKTDASEELFEDEGDASIEISEDYTDSEELDMSTINLMMQFCEKEELEETIGNEKVEEFLIFEQTEDVGQNPRDKILDGREYASDEQTQTVIDSYKKKKMSLMWSMIGCCIIAFIAFIYELLPVFGASLQGALDYRQYPAIYALVGLQFVVFAAAICYSRLWHGLKRALSLTPNTHSIIAIVLALTAVYDLIIVIVLAFSGDELPPMYNGIAVIITAVTAIADYLDVFAEERSFKTYSSKADKYTLFRETPKTGIGGKMYGGGLEASKVVYSTRSVDFPRGFFRSVNDQERKNSPLTLAIVPVIVIGMIASIISAVIGADAYSACAAFMLAIYAILPISFIFSDSVSNVISTFRLTKRGSTFVGDSAIDTYSKCDVVVFDDTHLFKKCTTDEVGFAIYDTSVGYLTLGCLDALFSNIGGPLSGMKIEGLPAVFKFNNVMVKRIARNGVEAIVEKRHSIIIGDHDFMRRYGLDFPKDETDNGRSTLCVSLNGKVTAKLSVKYRTDPTFEMLVERLYAEGVSVALRTADPLISSNTVAASRTIGKSPISIIHLGVDDISAAHGNYREDADGVIACKSKKKLAELVVWIKKLKRVRKLSGLIAVGFSAVGVVALALLVAFGGVGFVNQLYIMLYLLLELGAITGVMIAFLPTKKHFTVDALYAELERAATKR